MLSPPRARIAHGGAKLVVDVLKSSLDQTIWGA